MTLVSNQDIDAGVSIVSTQLPNVRTASADGVTVDRAGYTRAMFIAHLGTITDGTFAFDPEESDDGVEWSNIAASDLSGAFVSGTSAADDRTQVVGYLGHKRYLRCNLAVTGSPETGGAVGVTVVLAGARRVTP
jgi:hypothetical protein